MGKLALVDEEGDAFRDRCGVVGIYGHREAANLVYLGLYALQHRGQESAGIVAGDGEALVRKVGVGLVADVFDATALGALDGKVAIGHVRYATAGDPNEHLRDAQPLLVRCQAGPISVGHNGNLTNALALRRRLEDEGSIFQTTSDTEVICHLVARRRGTLLERLKTSLAEVRGAYSLVVMGDGRLYGVRDPAGVRPLLLGKLGDAWLFASETSAFDLIGAQLVREVAPGEIAIVDENGVTSDRLANPDRVPHASCVFEHVYFARPDSLVFGRAVHVARKEMGKELAREAPIDADVVIPVPDSGIYAAMGFADESHVPFEMGLVRNHYVGRTFIEPEQGIRNFGVKLKLNPVRALIAGKRVVVVDDSIVRGTTSKKIVETIRGAGAREVHVRISAPPTTNPCFYGIDTPTREELIAAVRTPDEIRAFLGADTLAYLSLDGLRRAMARAAPASSSPVELCDACFSGNYPIPIGP